MTTKDSITERLDEISKELEAMESADDAYARGVEDGNSEILNRAFPSREQLATTLITIISGVLISGGILFGIWQFVHWAAQQDEVAVCTQYASGERECHLERR